MTLSWKTIFIFRSWKHIELIFSQWVLSCASQRRAVRPLLIRIYGMLISLSPEQLFDPWPDPKRWIVLSNLMYIRVAAQLANSKRFVSSNFIAPSCHGNGAFHSIPSRNDIRIVQWQLPHAGTWEVSCSSNNKERTYGNPHVEWCLCSHFNGMTRQEYYVLSERLKLNDNKNMMSIPCQCNTATED